MPLSAASTWGRQCPGWDSHPHSSEWNSGLSRARLLFQPPGQCPASCRKRWAARGSLLRAENTGNSTSHSDCLLSRPSHSRDPRSGMVFSPRASKSTIDAKTGDRHCPPCVRRNAFRAVDGTRTRDHLLGKQEPYQLGHYRMVACRESSRSLDSDLQSEIEELPAIALRAITCSHEPADTCVICSQSHVGSTSASRASYAHSASAGPSSGRPNASGSSPDLESTPREREYHSRCHFTTLASSPVDRLKSRSSS